MQKSQHIDLPPVILASGTMGFFGEGYPYHALIWPFPWIAKQTALFAAKTVTVDKVIGNMSLKDDSSPKQLRPDCIFIDFKRWWHGGMLNAVALSNFRLEYYLKQGRWQKRTKLWALSLMLVRKTHEERIAEVREFVKIMQQHVHQFNVLPIIKLNISCPNTSHDICDLVGEQQEILSILSVLGLKIIVKINALADVESVLKISEHKACSGICVSNTLLWDVLPDAIKQKVFPEFHGESPLKKYGGGGYSGKHLLPIVLSWISRARKAGITKPIIGGGGIFTPHSVWKMYRVGASAISIGSPLLFRPWMVPLNILTAYILFKWIPKKRR